MRTAPFISTKYIQNLLWSGFISRGRPKPKTKKHPCHEMLSPIFPLLRAFCQNLFVFLYIRCKLPVFWSEHFAFSYLFVMHSMCETYLPKRLSSYQPSCSLLYHSVPFFSSLLCMFNFLSPFSSCFLFHISFRLPRLRASVYLSHSSSLTSPSPLFLLSPPLQLS